MHDNSIKAYKKLGLTFSQHAVLQIYDLHNRGLTDREVKTFGNYEDMDEVRPRITELIGLKKIKECGDVVDQKTHISVRICKIVRPTKIKDSGQGDFFNDDVKK